MADGRKTGGRKKGIPNKSTVIGKTYILQFIDDYKTSGLMAADFAELEPKDRLTIAEKLMQYCIPKLQATAVEVSAADKHSELLDRLASLAGEDEPKT